MQVADDWQLLDLMMTDMRQADELYRPTNYWAVYGKLILRELKAQGLRDFRRRQLSALAAAGALDLHSRGGVAFSRRVRNHCLNVRDRLNRHINWPIRVAEWLDRALNVAIPVQSPHGVTEEQIQQMAAELTHCKAREAGAKALTDFEASLAGNPDGVFEVEGRKYTMSVLYYYLRYVYCARWLDFGHIRVLVELGSGSGKQLEVLRKLYPRITYLAFDIPPQLYVCEQFLKAVFPESVVSYRETREAQSVEDLHPLREGAVYILASWHFPLLERLAMDLFWNAASFQEMEPDIVANYLQVVNRQAKWAFLQEQFSGKPRASRAGERGVMEPVALEHYRAALPDFEMVDMSPSWGPLGVLAEEDVYHDSMWRRKAWGRPCDPHAEV